MNQEKNKQALVNQHSTILVTTPSPVSTQAAPHLSPAEQESPSYKNQAQSKKPTEHAGKKVTGLCALRSGDGRGAGGERERMAAEAAGGSSSATLLRTSAVAAHQIFPSPFRCRSVGRLTSTRPSSFPRSPPFFSTLSRCIARNRGTDR